MGKANRDEAALAIVLAAILNLKGRTIEDERGKCEVEPAFLQIRIVLGLVPLEAHSRLYICIYTVGKPELSHFEGHLVQALAGYKI